MKSFLFCATITSLLLVIIFQGGISYSKGNLELLGEEKVLYGSGNSEEEVVLIDYYNNSMRLNEFKAFRGVFVSVFFSCIFFMILWIFWEAFTDV